MYIAPVFACCKRDHVNHFTVLQYKSFCLYVCFSLSLVVLPSLDYNSLLNYSDNL